MVRFADLLSSAIVLSLYSTVGFACDTSTEEGAWQCYHDDPQEACAVYDICHEPVLPEPNRGNPPEPICNGVSPDGQAYAGPCNDCAAFGCYDPNYIPDPRPLDEQYGCRPGTH